MRILTIFRNMAAIVLILAAGQKATAQVEVHALPEKDAPYTSSLYEVSVRSVEETTWHPVTVLRCDVNTRRVQHAAYAEFDMGSPVVVKIRKCDSLSISNVVVRPGSRKIACRQTDSHTVELQLERPEYLSVEFNGDREHNVHILANALLTERHTANEPQTLDWVGEESQDVFIRNPRLIYFAPGVHRPKDLPGGDIKIPSNCTVYLAPGAVVKARLIVDHAENVRIIGRGILDHPLRGVEITYSKNVLVDGITVLNPSHYTVFGGESEDITIRNIKSFSAKSWTDGIDLMCCRRVKIENCFLRTSDDCIALYNHRWWFWGGSEDIDVSRCIFWPDVAHPVNIGSHGDDRNPDGETLSHVRIHDCDILYNKGAGLLAINCGDNNHIRDVEFSDIRVEGIAEGHLFDLCVYKSPKYNRAPGCCIDSVSYKNIQVAADSKHMGKSRIVNYDATRGVRRTFFENIQIDGKPFNLDWDVIRK